MASSPAARPPSTKPLQLEITIVSAKHLKNVNWQNGDLKPYAAFWLDPDRRFTTQPDNSGSTRPVWNERFTLPINQSLNESVLTLEIFHSIPSEPSKPLVGTLRLPLMDLDDLDDSNRIRIFELCRPSGRPQGKIRLKLGIHERPVPDYHITPAPSYYYTPAPPHPSHFPPPPHTRDYGGYSPSPYSSIPPPPATVSAPPPPYAPLPPAPSSSLSPYAYGAYSDNYSYYPPYNSQPPPPPHPRPFFERQLGYGGPSAPVDYSPYDQKPKGSKMGLGSGVAVGGVAGALGGLSLDESMKYEKEKIAERTETDRAVRDDYSEYRDY